MGASRVDMKVVLLGKEYGGKTSLVERYLHDRFAGDTPYQNTIGAAFGAKKVDIGDKVLTLGVWDTAGSERYEAMSRIYYRGAKAAIVCYDLTDRTSFERARFWVNELMKNEEGCKIYLCGTKKDLVISDKRTREVDYHMTTDYAEEIHAEVHETSSKTGENIFELFTKIAKDFASNPENIKKERTKTKRHWIYMKIIKRSLGVVVDDVKERNRQQGINFILLTRNHLVIGALSYLLYKLL